MTKQWQAVASAGAVYEPVNAEKYRIAQLGVL